MELIRITSVGCPACVIMREVMRRVMPEFPNVEIIDLDRELDEEEADRLNPEHNVPFLKLGDETLTGMCKMDEFREFMRKAIAAAQ